MYHTFTTENLLRFQYFRFSGIITNPNYEVQFLFMIYSSTIEKSVNKYVTTFAGTSVEVWRV